LPVFQFRLRGKPAMGIESARRLRKSERGQTLVITAVGMVAVLAMTVLAIDIVALYVAKDQVQATADAAALAGAEALAYSGTTSAPSVMPLSTVCNGASGQGDLWAQAVVAHSPIAGGLATATTSCSAPSDTNPRIQVTVTRTGLPKFFARTGGGLSASATATAEAYNPSLDLNPGPPIQIQGVKPWLIFNGPSASPAYFTSTYAVANGGNFIGTIVALTLLPFSTPPTLSTQFYALDLPAPLSCPTNGAISCSQIGTGPPGIYYHDNIACSGSLEFGNNQSIPMASAQVDTRSFGTLQSRTSDGVQCLIHAGGNGLGQGQDIFTTAGPPVTITGGSNNPDPALRGASIHRSDSVVTAPVFNCPAVGTCDGTGAAPLQIVGYLQLGIRDFNGGGNIEAVILNAAGTDPASTGTPITGAGSSPVPVRLIQ
jgi:Flp pilus assembly protein TadG